MNEIKASPNLAKFFERLLELKKEIKERMHVERKHPIAVSALENIYSKLDDIIKEAPNA